MKSSSARRSKPPPSQVADLKKLIQKVERTLNARIDLLQGQLQGSGTALAAARLRNVNKRQAREGVARLRADLKALHRAGIIDHQGRRIRATLPPAMVDPASDVV